MRYVRAAGLLAGAIVALMVDVDIVRALSVPHAIPTPSMYVAFGFVGLGAIAAVVLAYATVRGEQ